MGLNHLEPIKEYQEAVYQDTWGHLAPKKNVTYKGQILVAKSGYGGSDRKIIEMEWENLDDSPWLFDHVNNWIWDSRDLMKEDGVYWIKTTFRNYRMWGKIAKIMSLEMLKNK
jgi:hypothetical protein